MIYSLFLALLELPYSITINSISYGKELEQNINLVIDKNYSKMEENKVTFEKKKLDRLSSFRFKMNFWLLNKLGLEGFRIIHVVGGVLITVLVYEFIL